MVFKFDIETPILKPGERWDESKILAVSKGQHVTTKNKYDQLLLHNLSKCMMSLYPKFYKSIWNVFEEEN